MLGFSLSLFCNYKVAHGYLIPESNNTRLAMVAWELYEPHNTAWLSVCWFLLLRCGFCLSLFSNKIPDSCKYLLDKQMHQTMLQMCAAPICAAHHTSQVQILASGSGSCMWNA